MPKKAVRRGSRSRRAASAPRRNDRALRKHLLTLLASSEAHIGIEDAVAGIPPHLVGVRPARAAHTAWQLLEHLRICQRDILEFSRNPKHVSPAWPDGYWPATGGPPDDEAWQKSIAAVHADRRAMQKLVSDPKRDLFARVNHRDAKAKHTLLREVLLIADHNAYHVGQLVLLRRLLGAAQGSSSFAM
jgi:uncharacterized damage-inducible protein DinB